MRTQAQTRIRTCTAAHACRRRSGCGRSGLTLWRTAACTAPTARPSSVGRPATSAVASTSSTWCMVGWQTRLAPTQARAEVRGSTWCISTQARAEVRGSVWCISTQARAEVRGSIWCMVDGRAGGPLPTRLAGQGLNGCRPCGAALAGAYACPCSGEEPAGLWCRLTRGQWGAGWHGWCFLVPLVLSSTLNAV